MRIYDRDLTGAAAAETGRGRETQKIDRENAAATSRGGNRESGDRVELSAGLGELARAVSAYGAERRSRIEELSALHQNGNYRPDSAAVSRAMVTEAVSAGRE